jgi:predicted esterase
MKHFKLLICLFLCGCSLLKNKTISGKEWEVTVENLNLFDSTRSRSIPVAVYKPKTKEQIKNQKLVIFSHGYGENKGGDNMVYSYLTENLASKGYVVASIQHELPTDSLLAMTGNLQITRRPNWERGANNILFVLNQLKKTNPELDYKHVILAGHSNGGDMTVLFAHMYPSLVYKVIALDNRRMALPRVKHPKIYSIRSSDLAADEGVLPTSQEQQKLGITIVNLANTKHSEMDNDANEQQRREINDLVLSFLD